MVVLVVVGATVVDVGATVVDVVDVVGARVVDVVDVVGGTVVVVVVDVVVVASGSAVMRTCRVKRSTAPSSSVTMSSTR